MEYEGREGRKDKRIEVVPGTVEYCRKRKDMEKEKKSMVEVNCCLFLNKIWDDKQASTLSCRRSRCRRMVLEPWFHQ